MSSQTYDRIGGGYARRRQADPRIGARIREAIGQADLVLNVGAGAGSYEPTDCRVVAVEPALTMIRQRGAIPGAAVRARAEELPFGDKRFDVATAILTVHHWVDWRAGVLEMARTARRLVLFTWDPTASFWLEEYLPAVWEEDRRKFPDPRAIASLLGGARSVVTPIPSDCTDGFLGAYWRRPDAYLDPGVRASMSTLAAGASVDGLDRLAADLSSGDWKRKYGDVLAANELDVGYRLVVCDDAFSRGTG
jgi:SAM-dependent methyltransferase